MRTGHRPEVAEVVGRLLLENPWCDVILRWLLLDLCKRKPGTLEKLGQASQEAHAPPK